MTPQRAHSNALWLERFRRWVPLAVWVIVILVILAIPLRILRYGFLPPDDALREAAQAVSGKTWPEILVLHPFYSVDHEFGWHHFLRLVFLWSHCSAGTLVALSVVVVFAGATGAALPWLKRPEAWLVALIAASLATDLPLRFSLGRPFLLTVAGLLTILFRWQARSAPPTWRTALWLTGIIALCIFAHGIWYLWVLPVAAFFLAGQFRWGVTLAAAWAAGSMLGAAFTGHPVQAYYVAVQMAWRPFTLHTAGGTLANELQPSPGEVLGLVILGGLLVLRQLAKLEARPLSASPVFWLACLGWLVGFKAVRGAADWGWPALMVLIACDLQLLLQSRLAADSFKRLGLTCGLALTAFAVFTSDIGSRWTQSLTWTYLEQGNPDLKGWLPDKGGLFYTPDMTVFFQTFFKNPRADWRYVLGFEPALMPDDDFRVYQSILRRPGDPKALQPWVQKMKPADRLVIRGGAESPPSISQLEWGYGVNGLWIGRLPQRNDLRPSDAEGAAITAAQIWLALIDAGQYSEGWKEAGTVFQSAVAEPDSVAALGNDRRVLGNVLARRLKSAKLTQELPGAPDGPYVVMEFETAFANRKSAVETVTFRLEKDRRWKAAGYFIN
jgi:hypothetical protein